MDINSMLNSVSPAPQFPPIRSNIESAGASNTIPKNEEMIMSSSGNPGLSLNQRIEPNDQDIQSIELTVEDAEPRIATSPRRTRNNNRPTNIKIENGASSVPHQAQPSPHAPKQSSKLANPPQIAEQVTMTELDDVILEPNEHIIPLSVPTRVYDQYLQIIDRYANHYSALLSDVKPDTKTIKAMERMVVELDMITTHPDLIDKSVLDGELNLNGGELNYGRSASFKFGVLYRLLETLHDGLSAGIPEVLSGNLKDKTQFKLAIIGWDGKLIKILVRFLLSMNISFTTAEDGQVYNPEKKNVVDLIIIPASFDKTSQLSPVDTILALDSSFSRRGQLAEALQGKDAQKVPILFPWVYASPEHIRACLPITDQGGLDSLRTYTTILIQTRTDLGQLRGTWDKAIDARTEGVGMAVGQWILNGFTEEYPFPNFDPIELPGLELIFKPGKKRQFEDREDDGSSSPSKRRRVQELLDKEMTPDVISTGEEIVLLKDHIKSLSTSLRVQENKLQEHNSEILKLNSTLDAARADFERERKKLEDENKKHERVSQGLMEHCDKALNQVQRSRTKIADLRGDNDRLQAAVVSKTAGFDQLKIEMDDLRAKVKDLENAKPHVSSNGSTDLTTLETDNIILLRSENESLQKEISSLKRKAQSAEENRAYAFHLYQEASSRAVELAGEVQEKDSEIDRLIPLVENHSKIILQAAADSELATTRLALDRALLEKEELEEQLRRGNSRQGMNTRGQSTAPGTSRSPRVAVSPPARSRASSRQPGSRATSPTGKGGQVMRRALSGRLAE